MIRILCLGDSLTNGARNEYYRNYPIELNYLIKKKNKIENICFNESVNGETSSEILRRSIKILETKKYDLILLLAGTNDTKIPIPPKIYRQNILQIINLSKINETNIYLGLLPPIYSGLPCYSQKEGNKIIKKYNQILISLSRIYNLKYADFSNLNENLYSDGVHLTYKGYLEMAKRWYNTICNEL